MRVAVAVTPRYPAPRGEMLPVSQVPAARQSTLRLGHFAPRRLLPIEYPQPACHFEPDHLLRNISRPVSDMQHTPPSRKKPVLSSLSLPLAPRPVLRPMRTHGEPVNHGLPGEPLAYCGWCSLDLLDTSGPAPKCASGGRFSSARFLVQADRGESVHAEHVEQGSIHSPRPTEPSHVLAVFYCTPCRLAGQMHAHLWASTANVSYATAFVTCAVIR